MDHDMDKIITSLSSCYTVEDFITYFTNNFHNVDNYTKHGGYQKICYVVKVLDHLYHNQGNSPISDKQYDLLMETIQIYFSKFQNGKKVGSLVNQEDAVLLPYFMASMNKFKNVDDISRWTKKYIAPYTITAKLDGISGMFHNQKLYTRGNGKFGRDISFLIPFLNLSSTFDFAANNFALRGELIIRKSTFQQKYKDKYSNARNLVCGLLNRNFSCEYIDLYNDIDFVVYDLYHFNPLQFCHKINIITKSGIDFVLYKNNVQNLQISTLDGILNHWKTSYDYEIDGIIVTNDKQCLHPNDANPDFAFAYKNNIIGVEIKEGVVEKVVWTVSKDNYLKPKIKLIESICCNGSNIEYVTGFHARYILQNEIAYGTKLRIGLSGNVIPYIFDVIRDDDDEIDDPELKLALDCPKVQALLKDVDCESYDWNKSKVDLVSNDTDNPYVKIKQNSIFFNTFGLKCSLQETTLKNVYDSLGIFELHHVLSLNEEQWSQVEKVASKKAHKIVSSVYNVLDWKVLTKDKSQEQIEILCCDYLLYYLSGLLSFPRGFAQKKIQCHLDYLVALSSAGKIDLRSCVEIDYVESIVPTIVKHVDLYKVNQVTTNSARLFCEGFIAFLGKYEKLYHEVDNIDFPKIEILIVNGLVSTEESSESSNVVEKNGMNVVFSGIRDKNKENEFVENGYFISDVVNSKTHLLVVKDMTSMSGKMKKAKQLGVKVVTLQDLL
tara:strand:- start:507 stop:2669 length:2163 start_codon:yes stop_codon:yes gene_type:complete